MVWRGIMIFYDILIMPLNLCTIIDFPFPLPLLFLISGRWRERHLTLLVNGRDLLVFYKHYLPVDETYAYYIPLLFNYSNIIIIVYSIQEEKFAVQRHLQAVEVECHQPASYLPTDQILCGWMCPFLSPYHLVFYFSSDGKLTVGEVLLFFWRRFSSQRS